jgi:indole-3-acetate monooxygenase
MTTTTRLAVDVVAAARELAPKIAAMADETEAGRRVPLALVEEMTDRGLFSMTIPRAFGGLEVDYMTYFDTVEEVSRADGSTGWVLLIGLATQWFVSGFLAEPVAREIFGGDRVTITAGAFPPRGRATVVPGGYRVTGRWPFGSGCQHASWFMAGSVVQEGGKTRRNPDGSAELVTVVMPRSDWEVLDTWNVNGLRGTGSHDVEVNDVFVPAERTWPVLQERAVQQGPLYAVRGAAWLGQAAHACGVARRALDEFVAMSGGPRSFATGEQLRDRHVVQMKLAEAEATVRSARAFIREVAAEVWDTLVAGQEVTPRQRALLRLSFTDAVNRCALATQTVYTLCGMGSVWSGSPIDRAFRDLNVATHHAAVGLHTYEAAGRVMLGLEAGVPLY